MEERPIWLIFERELDSITLLHFWNLSFAILRFLWGWVRSQVGVCLLELFARTGGEREFAF